MEQELLIFSEYLTHFCFIVAGCCLTIIFCVVFCRTLLFVFFVCFLLVIVLSVLRRITASDYPIWYLQTYLSLSLLLDYLYTSKASMYLLTRYYSVVVVELSPFMLYASFVVIKCDPHYRKMFEKTYWKILHILLLETTNLIGKKLHIMIFEW